MLTHYTMQRVRYVKSCMAQMALETFLQKAIVQVIGCDILRQSVMKYVPVTMTLSCMVCIWECYLAERTNYRFSTLYAII